MYEYGKQNLIVITSNVYIFSVWGKWDITIYFQIQRSKAFLENTVPVM